MDICVRTLRKSTRRCEQIQIGWRLTVQWLAGNFACKAFVFLRAFGLYLSSNVLVCVSVDRYFAVLHPLKVNDARRRGKCMLAWAWSVSLICAIPQSIIFHVMPHPNNPDFHQCVTHGSFSSNIQQTAYNIFGLLVMYFFPLTVIIGAYTAIMCEISNKSKENKEDTYQTTTGRMRLRRSDISNIERARTRTLRMTIMIVVVFIICWTPYVVMTLWYTFDEETIGRIPNWLQDTLFMMAVSNSCMNPLVYGSYAINFRKQCCKFFCCSTSSSQRNLAVGSGVTRSTTILQTVANRSPISRPDNHCTGLLPKKLERPINFNHISFLSEQASHRCYRQSFHSDPYPCPDDVVGDNSQNSCGSDAHALANLL